MKTAPVECGLLVIALLLPTIIAAENLVRPDAALLEFLADWDAADMGWLEAELDDVTQEAVIEGAAAPAHAEKSHE